MIESLGSAAARAASAGSHEEAANLLTLLNGLTAEDIQRMTDTLRSWATVGKVRRLQIALDRYRAQQLEILGKLAIPTYGDAEMDHQIILDALDRI